MQNQKSKYFMRNWLAIFFGAVGSQTMYILMYNYSLIFFTNFLGISAGVAGTIFMLSRMWDAVNDPMCGTIIDKTDSRFGKTQPFMLGGGLITAIGLVMLFTIPNLSLTGKAVWGTVAYNMVGMAFTAVTVSTLVQMPRASRDSQERVHFSASYSIGCSITGILVAMAVTKGLSAFGTENPAKGYQIVALFSAVIGLVFLIGNVFLFKDQAAEEEKGKEKAKVKEMIGAVLHTPPFLIVVLSSFIMSVGGGLSGGSLLYYVNYVLGKPELIQILLPLMYIGTFASSLTAGYLSKFGKIKMYKVSLILVAVGMAGRVITRDSSIVTICIFYVIYNIGNGYMGTYLLPILMDCADYTEYKTGVKCEALTMTGFTLCGKMAAGIGTAVLGFALQAAGYNGQAAEQSTGAVRMITGMHVYSMVIFAIVGLALFSFYKLDAATMEKVAAAKEAKIVSGE